MTKITGLKKYIAFLTQHGHTFAYARKQSKLISHFCKELFDIFTQTAHPITLPAHLGYFKIILNKIHYAYDNNGNAYPKNRHTIWHGAHNYAPAILQDFYMPAFFKDIRCNLSHKQLGMKPRLTFRFTKPNYTLIRNKSDYYQHMLGH